MAVRKESRVDRLARIARGMTDANDAAAAFAFANRLRSAFVAFTRLDEGAPLTEPMLDALLTAKEATQVVADGTKVAEDIVKSFVAARAAAGDALYTPDDTTTTVYLGLPTFPKRFSVENREKDTVDAAGMVAAMVRDGLLTAAQGDTYLATFTKHTPYLAVAYKANPTYAGA